MIVGGYGWDLDTGIYSSIYQWEGRISAIKISKSNGKLLRIGGQ